MSKAADLVEQSAHETLAYYAFPDIHWQKIRTNNPLERIMREIRRRTKVVGARTGGSRPGVTIDCDQPLRLIATTRSDGSRPCCGGDAGRRWVICESA